MDRTAGLVSVLHQIDTLRGKVCATCNYWQRRGLTDCHGNPVGHCLCGYSPYGPDDGCDDWQATATGCTKILK